MGQDERVEPTPITPGLPGDAPPALREFVACRRESYVFVESGGTIDWLPRPPLVPSFVTRPRIALEERSPGVIAVRASWLSVVSITMLASVVDGRLTLDTSGVPEVTGLRGPIANWVRELNTLVAFHGYGFAPLELDDGRLVLQKVRRAP